MRKKLIVGNWKMYNNTHKASLLLNALSEKVKSYRSVDVVLCPNLLALQSLSLQINHRQFRLGAQNCYWRDEGAFTGEVAAEMLRGVVDYVIVGHSERRHVFHETERDIRQKVQAVLRNRMRPILCVGETAGERADGETIEIVRDQLISGLANITSEEMTDLAIAYEPVWAIGTGVVATTGQAQEMHRFIRQLLFARYGEPIASEMRILYGGSVNATNASDLFTCPDVDGGLVGGASLKAVDFLSIIAAAGTNR